jgi:hypothetical protein
MLALIDAHAHLNEVEALDVDMSKSVRLISTKLILRQVPK